MMTVMVTVLVLVVPGCHTGTRWIPAAPRRRIAGVGCVHPWGVMELGQRVYRPGCRRVVCKTFAGRPILEEQFCDPLPENLPPTCIFRHRPEKRHPDCCPRVICAPGSPSYTGWDPSISLAGPERRYQPGPGPTHAHVITKPSYGPAGTNETYARVVGYPKTPKLPISVAMTSAPTVITSEVIYGKGFSDPWTGEAQVSTESNLQQGRENHRYQDLPLWEEPSSFALDPLSNNIRVSEAKDNIRVSEVEDNIRVSDVKDNIRVSDVEENIRVSDVMDNISAYIPRGKGGALLDEAEQREFVNLYFATPAPQNLQSTPSTTPQTHVSYWHFSEANDVRTSPHPFRDYSSFLPITKLFSTTRLPMRKPTTKLTTESSIAKLSISYTQWKPITKIVTASPFSVKEPTASTTPRWSWSPNVAESSVETSSTGVSRYYPSKRPNQQTPPFHSSTRTELRKPYVPTKPANQIRTSLSDFDVYKRVSRRPTHRSHIAKKPGANKVPTPRPSVEVTRTTPASYEFATPKLNPSKHDIHEFILTPLDPSQLIPGHDEYLQAKYNAMREYLASSEEKIYSKKSRRSLPYTEATTPYEYSSTISSASPNAPSSPTPEITREKKRRPVFYIPWRNNLTSRTTMTPAYSDYGDDHPTTSARSLPHAELVVLGFNQPNTLATATPPVDYTTSQTNIGAAFEAPHTETFYKGSKTYSPSYNENLYFAQQSKETKVDVAEIGLNHQNNDELMDLEDIDDVPVELTTMTAATTLATVGPTTTLPEHLQHTFPPPEKHIDATDVFLSENRELSNYSREANNVGDDSATASGGDSQKPQRIAWSPPPFRPNSNQNPSVEITKTQKQVPAFDSFADKDYMGILLYEPRKQDSGSQSSDLVKLDEYEKRPDEGSELKRNLATKAPTLNLQPEVEAEIGEVITSNKPIIAEAKYDGTMRQDDSKIIEKEITTKYRPGQVTLGTSSFPFVIVSSTNTTPSSIAGKVEDSYFESEIYENTRRIPHEMTTSIVETKSLTHLTRPTKAEMLPFNKWDDTHTSDSQHENVSLGSSFSSKFPLDDEEKESEEGFSHAIRLYSMLKLSKPPEPITVDGEISAAPPYGGQLSSPSPDSSLHPIYIKELEKLRPPPTTMNPRRRRPLIASRTSQPKLNPQSKTSSLLLETNIGPINRSETQLPTQHDLQIHTPAPSRRLSISRLGQQNRASSLSAKAVDSQKENMRPKTRDRLPPGTFTRKQTTPRQRDSRMRRPTAKTRRTIEPQTTTEPRTTTEHQVTIEPQITRAPRTTTEHQATIEPQTITEPWTTTEHQATIEPQTTTKPQAIIELLTTTEHQATTEILTTREPQVTIEPQATIKPYVTTDSLTNTERERSNAVVGILSSPTRPRRITSFTYKSMIHRQPGIEGTNLKDTQINNPFSPLPVVPSAREASVSSVELPVIFREHVDVTRVPRKLLSGDSPQKTVSGSWEPIREE